AYSAMPTLIVSAVPAAETGAANGLNTLMRSIGMSTSSAVVGVILAHQTIDFGGVALPSKDGVKISFLVACAASVGGLLIALCLPGRQRAKRTAGSGPVATSAPVADSAPVVDSAPVGVPVAVAEPVAEVVDDLPVLTGGVIHGRVLGPGDT